MKTKQDFITNSSSSSFIVALNRRTSLYEMFRSFEKNFSKIIELINKNPSWFDNNILTNDILEGESMEKMTRFFVSYIVDGRERISVKEWDIYIIDIESWSKNLGDFILYNMENIDTESVVLKREW